MKSIAEIFDNSKELLDSITYFVDKYIGASLLRRCNITKITDSVTENTAYMYVDNPFMRLVGTVRESKFPEKCVDARQQLTDKIPVGFTAASPYRMFETGNFFPLRPVGKGKLGEASAGNGRQCNQCKGVLPCIRRPSDRAGVPFYQ